MSKPPIERNYNLSFGKKVRRERLKHFPGISLDEFASSLSISGSYLGNIELGKVPPPSAEVVIALAEKLGVEKQLLLEDAGYLHPDYVPLLRGMRRTELKMLKQFNGLVKSQGLDISLLEYIQIVMGVLDSREGKDISLADSLRLMADIVDSKDPDSSQSVTIEQYRQKGKELFDQVAKVKTRKRIRSEKHTETANQTSDSSMPSDQRKVRRARRSDT